MRSDLFPGYGARHGLPFLLAHSQPPGMTADQEGGGDEEEEADGGAHGLLRRHYLPSLPLDRVVPGHVLLRRGAISFGSCAALLGGTQPRLLSQVPASVSSRGGRQTGVCYRLGLKGVNAIAMVMVMSAGFNVRSVNSTSWLLSTQQVV